MCLVVKKPKLNFIIKLFGIKWNKPLIAKKDIHCFKFYRIINDNTVKTIYQSRTYDINKPLPEVKLGIYYPNSSIIEIDEGYHSYVNNNEEESGNEFHAIIPKGSKYYKGIFHGKKSYASTNLIIGKRVEK